MEDWQTSKVARPRHVAWLGRSAGDHSGRPTGRASGSCLGSNADLRDRIGPRFRRDRAFAQPAGKPTIRKTARRHAFDFRQQAAPSGAVCLCRPTGGASSGGDMQREPQPFDRAEAEQHLKNGQRGCAERGAQDDAADMRNVAREQLAKAGAHQRR
jgi:hypothetical protein